MTHSRDIFEKTKKRRKMARFTLTQASLVELSRDSVKLLTLLPGLLSWGHQGQQDGST